jgi:hypothetical protein
VLEPLLLDEFDPFELELDLLEVELLGVGLVTVGLEFGLDSISDPFEFL